VEPNPVNERAKTLEALQGRLMAWFVIDATHEKNVVTLLAAI
jgi:hypothetical protein